MNQTSDDFLKGGPDIAAWLGVKKGRVWALVRDGKIPVFKLGGKIHARKSTLLKWIEMQEEQAFSGSKTNPNPTEEHET